MGENGKGTFLSAWLQTDVSAKNKSRIVSANLRSRNLAGREDKKSPEGVLSNTPFFSANAVYYRSVAAGNVPFLISNSLKDLRHKV